VHTITRTQRHRLLVGAAAGALTLAWALSAAAAPAPTAEGQVAEVVVTAEKKVERLQDVPASVAVVDAQALRSQGAVKFTDYVSQVPGMTLTSIRTGQAQITLRGITTGPAQSASATNFYIDEAPIGSVNAYTTGSSTTPDLDPADLARIEVLKGPQGTLYGAGSVGGLVKFVTAEPNFDTMSGRVSASVADVTSGGTGQAFRGLVNLPIIHDKLALRVSGYDRRDPGYIDNVGPIGGADINGVHVQGGRIALSAKLGGNVRADLSTLAQDTKANGFNLEDVNLTTLQPLYGDLTVRRFTAEPSKVNLRLTNLKLTGDAGPVKLLSSTTYQTVKSDIVTDGSDSFGVLLGLVTHIPNFGVRGKQGTKTERFSEEVRGDTSVFGGALDLQGGLYFTHENDQNRIPNFDAFFTNTGAPIPVPNLVTASIVSRYTEYSIFASGTWHITGKFDLLAGLRYSYDDQHYLQDYAGLLIGPRRVNVASETGDIVTYMVSPRYKLSDDAMVYGRIATGYRPGGPNAVPPPSVVIAPDTFQPDKLTSYELGYKAAYLDHKMTLDAALFYTDWNDIQIQTSTAGFNYFVNGGTAISQGGELTLQLAPVRGLSLTATGAYTDAHLTAPAPGAGGADGDRLPFVPRWAGSLNAEYTWPIEGSSFSGMLGGNVAYTGSRVSDYSAKFPRKIPSYTTLNIRGGIENDNWALTLFARNISNERGFTALAARGVAPGPQGPYSAGVITPRTIGAELAYRW
jgi:outer membrane receptor protein involved in Fe transport